MQIIVWNGGYYHGTCWQGIFPNEVEKAVLTRLEALDPEDTCPEGFWVLDDVTGAAEYFKVTERPRAFDIEKAPKAGLEG